MKSPQLAEIGALGGNAQVKEDGSFEFRDVAGSTYWVVLGLNSDKFRDFYLKSVQLDGREVVDTGFAVNGPVTVDVVMSAKGGTVDGTVVNGDGDGVPNVSVVSVPSWGKAARVDYYQVENRLHGTFCNARNESRWIPSWWPWMAPLETPVAPTFSLSMHPKERRWTWLRVTDDPW